MLSLATLLRFLSRKLNHLYLRHCAVDISDVAPKIKAKGGKLTVETLIETELASIHAFVFIECGKNVNFNVRSNNNEYNLRN
jgi:hypothetical protein